MTAKNYKNVERELKSFLKGMSANEPTSKYSKSISYGQFFSNKMLVVRAIREGITQSFFMSIKEITPFSESDWSEFLGISLKSLQRYKKNKQHVFKSIHSEKIIELAEVASLGREVFDSSDQFHQWLYTPSFALGKMKPAELLKDSYGKEMVMNELNRIDGGVFA